MRDVFARLLAAALWVRIQTSLKKQNVRRKQKSGRHTLTRKNKFKIHSTSKQFPGAELTVKTGSNKDKEHVLHTYI